MKHQGCLLVALLIIAFSVSMSAPQAHADQYHASVTFTEVAVTDLGVSLQGEVTNSGWDHLYQVQVVLWVDNRPLTTQAQLRSALEVSPELDSGDRILNPAAISPITEGDQRFNSDTTQKFKVSATWDELNISHDAVYLLGVHVRGSAEPSGSQVTIGKGRTLATRATTTAATTATIVMFTTPPSLLHDTVFIDEHLSSELKGRLATLLTLASRPNVSWAIDPGLFHEITVMAKGYTVWDGRTHSEGRGSKVAQEWLTQFRTLNRDHGHRLPWGNPDLALGLTTGTDVVTASLQAELANPEMDDLPLLIRTHNGQANSALIDYLAPLKPELVLAEAKASVSLTDGVLLNTLATPFLGGPGPDDPSTTLQLRQRMIAENALSDSPLIRVVHTEDEASLFTLPSWVTTVPLNLIPVHGQWEESTATGEPQGTLTSAILDSLSITQSTMHKYADLIGDDTAVQLLTTAPIASITSQSWASDEQAAQYASSVDTWLHQIMASVTITARDVSLTSKTNVFPVWVTNSLSVPAFVRISSQVTPVSGSLALVSIPASTVIEVPPGDRLRVDLAASIIREGDVDANLSLSTSGGIPLDSTATIRIHASASAWMGWVVVGAGFVLFVVGTFLRVRTARRKKEAHE